MESLCKAPSSGAGFISGTLDFIDCQAQTIGEAGYQALAQPGSAVSLALTALLTIFVALFGVRLLLGRAPDFGESMIAALKIGVVLMLATSWAGYRVVVYDLVINGPAELAATVGGSASLPGATGGLTQRLQAVDDAILVLIDAGTGRLDPVASQQSTTAGAPPLRRAPISDDLAFGLGRVLYLSTVIGAFGLVRLAAGLLLALAPVFAGFLLFEITRSLFVGWIKMLFALLIAAFAVTVIVAVELAALEPWLSQILALRAAKFATPAAPTELLVIGLAFAAIVFGVIIISIRLAFASGIVASLGAPFQSARRSWFSQENAQSAGASSGVLSPQTSRAYAIADAMTSVQRREQQSGGASVGSATTNPLVSRIPETIREGRFASTVPLGQSYKRTTARVSAAGSQRNRRQ